MDLIKDRMGNAVHFMSLVIFQLLVLRGASMVLGSEYGLFAYCYAAASIAVAFTLMGLHGTLMRLLAICSVRNAWGSALRIIVRALMLRVGFIMLAVAGLWFYLSHSAISMDPEVFFYVGLFFVLQSLLVLQHSILQGLSQYSWMGFGSLCLFAGLLIQPENLSDVFKMLSLGYGFSLMVNSGVLVIYFSTKKMDATKIDQRIDLKHLIQFSLWLSLAALCTMIADHAPILLLKDRLPLEIYSVLALAFNLALYPARLNGFSEALIVPEMSKSWHVDEKNRIKERFKNWINALHFIGPLIVIPVVLVVRPFVQSFFAPELASAAYFAMILIVANIARLTSPVSMAVLVASGHPGKFAGCNALKMTIDLLLLLVLSSFEPKILVIALVLSWVVYANCLYALACKQLSLPLRLDSFLTQMILMLLAIVSVKSREFLLIFIWLLVLGYTVFKGKAWVAACRLK